MKLKLILIALLPSLSGCSIPGKLENPPPENISYNTRFVRSDGYDRTFHWYAYAVTDTKTGHEYMVIPGTGIIELKKN